MVVDVAALYAFQRDNEDRCHCQDIAPLGHYGSMSPAGTRILGDRPLDLGCMLVAPLIFNSFLIQAIAHLFGVQHATPKVPNGIGLAGQSEF